MQALTTFYHNVLLIKPLSNTKATKQECFLHKHFQRRPRYNEYNAQNSFEEKTPKHIQVAVDVYHGSKTICVICQQEVSLSFLR